VATASEQAVIDLLPTDGTPITFDAWKQAAATTGNYERIAKWTSMQKQGLIKLENVRVDPNKPTPTVLHVRRIVSG